MPAPVDRHLDLYGYWLERRGSRAMPARRDIDPVGSIPHLIASLLIVERAGDQFRARLAGSVERL